MSTEGRVSRFLIGVGLFSFVSLWIRLIESGYSLHQIISHSSIIGLSVSLVVLLAALPFSKKVNGLVQIGLVFCMGTLSIFEDFWSWYGMGILVITVVLLVKYGYFNKYLIFKVAIISLFFIVVIECSNSMMHSNKVKFFGIEATIFYFFFIGMIYICFGNRISMSSDRVRILKKKKEALEAALEVVSKQIAILEKKRLPFDFSGRDLTSEEMEVLQCLVKYRANDIEISKILNRSEKLIGSQLESIYQKLGAKDKDHAINLCKYNFT